MFTVTNESWVREYDIPRISPPLCTKYSCVLHGRTSINTRVVGILTADDLRVGGVGGAVLRTLTAGRGPVEGGRAFGKLVARQPQARVAPACNKRQTSARSFTQTSTDRAEQREEARFGAGNARERKWHCEEAAYCR